MAKKQKTQKVKKIQMEIHTNGTNSRRNSSSINVFHNATNYKIFHYSQKTLHSKRRTSLNTYTTIHSSIYIRISIHLFSFSILMKNIYKYLNKYYRKEKIEYEEIQKVRKDCINIPYTVFFVQIALFIGVGLFFNFIMLASAFAIMRFTLMIIALASILSIILLIGSQKYLYNVILTTYQVSSKYKKHTGYRIINSQNLLFQMVPFIAVILIIISLIGYSKAVQQEGFATANYYQYI